MRTLFLTSMALIAFAGNSVLCRLALSENEIDALNFTCIRLITGALVLLAICKTKTKASLFKKEVYTGYLAPLCLFVYAISFSYAYIWLDTATGALILFASVQISMIIISLLRGGHLNKYEKLGMFISFSGFFWMIFPELSSPSVIGFMLMVMSGISWSLYTYLGIESKSPISDTTANFTKTLPLVILCLIGFVDYSTLTLYGVMLAMVAGGMTSGIGYVIWYMALQGLSPAKAATVQLLVPVIAAVGGIVFIDDTYTSHLLITSVIIFSGIVLMNKAKPS